MSNKKTSVMIDKTKCTKIMHRNHPLSLGADVYLISTNPLFNDKIVEDSSSVEQLFVDQYELTGSIEGFHVLHSFTDIDEAHVVIWINSSTNLVRTIELIVHECSHAVDGFFERAAICEIDTEIRAYHMDWLVGQFMYQLKDIQKANVIGECNDQHE